MSYETSWNKLVFYYKKNYNKKEDIVQNSWEVLLSTDFGYLVDTEIKPQYEVTMGSSKNRADIVVQRSKDDKLFLMELKRHTLNNGQKQLFSYLNQVKTEIGILVCDKLYVYDFDYTQKSEKYSYVEIDFTQDNPDGIKFVELFTSDNFDRQKIKDFIAQKNQSKENIALIRKDLTDDFVLSVVKNHLTEKYPAEDVERGLKEMVITVRPKGAGTPAPVVGALFHKQKGKKDNTRYTVNGTPTGGKCPTVYAAVEYYVKSNPGITFEQLQVAFPDKAAKPGFRKVISLLEQVSQNEWEGSRFNKNPITLASGQQVVVSTQWYPRNMREFIEYAGRAGIVIEAVH